MFKPINKPKAYRFRRFSRAAYAAFNSMHREVTIGHVASYIADRQLGKQAAEVVAVASMLVVGGTLRAQSADEPEVRTLPAVEVILAADSLRASANPAASLAAGDFRQTSVSSMGELLALLPGIDLRTRGVHDVQADLAMRGGTFDQMALLLHGINLTDPQTGHHTLDLPIDLGMVSRVELLSPASLLARGVVGFCGGVNVVVDECADPDALPGPAFRADMAAGSYGTARASLLASAPVGGWELAVAGAYRRSDGYRPNTDYRHGSLYLQATRHSLHDDFHLSLGGQLKGFGSAGFYSTTYPDQYEATRTLTATAAQVHRFGHGISLHTAAYGRLHADRFELFRDGYAEAPSWYAGHNRHLSDLGGVRSVLKWRGLCVGAEVRHEGILSNVLGDSSTFSSHYPMASQRTSGTLFAGYSGRWRDLMWQASALALANSAFGADYACALNLSYQPLPLLRLTADVGRTYRMPTFTDLYYKSATQVADRHLKAEHSLCAEVGAHLVLPWLRASATLYHRQGFDIIDWMRRPSEELWYSMNHAEVDATGFDLAARATHLFRLGSLPLRATAGATYSYCYIAQDAGGWISGSALDYLRHSGRLYLALAPGQRFCFKADVQGRHREGSYVEADKSVHPYGSVLLLNATVEYALRDADAALPLTLYVSGYNLTDRSYRDHGGTPQPGLTLMIGLRLGSAAAL